MPGLWQNVPKVGHLQRGISIMTDQADQADLLIVDDTPANLRLLSAILGRQHYRVRLAQEGQAAVSEAQAKPPDLILLDIKMPGMSGYDVCRVLKRYPETCEVPIIFISAMDDVDEKIRALSMGGVDYITRPFEAQEVVVRVQNHLAIQSLQKQLKKANNDLQSQIQELDSFAHTVAHDLKNPLASVVGYSEILLDGIEYLPAETQKRYAEAIYESSNKMWNIIEELLLLASIRQTQDVQIERLDTAAIIDEVKRHIAYLIEKENATIEEPAEWPAARGHPPWVKEVWVNYLSNAIKYGGSPPRVFIGAERQGDKVRFWVRDNGVGLAPEEKARLFLPFRQISTDGQGLGLSLVRRIVEKLGGEVSVESAPGMGSTFSFTLPAA
jgi:signal transduction histidine kinase